MAQAISEFFSSFINESFNLKEQDVSWLTPDTEKYYQNITALNVSIPELSYTDQFLDSANLFKLTKSIADSQRRHAVARGNGKHAHSFSYYNAVVPTLAAKWAKENKIDDSTPLGVSSSVEVIDHLNDLFLDEYTDSKGGDKDVNLFEHKTYTQNPDGSHSFKDNESFGVDEMRSMDVFDPRDRQVTTDSSHYRYGNRIPHWQICGGGAQKVNMVDRVDIDGLRTRRPDEASLEQRNRGYDMSGITGSTYTMRDRKTKDDQEVYRRKSATMRQRSYGEPLWT